MILNFHIKDAPSFKNLSQGQVCAGNNESISEYSKFHIRSEFLRNCSCFSKSCSPQSIDWLKRLKENFILGGMIPVGTGFKGLAHCSSQHKIIPFKTKKKNLFEGGMRDILFHHI